MAFFLFLVKHIQKKNYKCATTALLLCCYLYRKRSYAIDIMRKLKSKVEICKLPSTTSVFLPRYREARKHPPNSRWSPSQGIPRKSQASGRVTPWIAPGLSHAQVGLLCAFRQVSPGPLPAVFTIKLPAKTSRALFPPVHSDGHTTNAVGVIS